jgi:hypothetical protein
MGQKVNTIRRAFYVALNCQAGLTDLVLEVRVPNGNMFGNFPMVEAGDGLYYVDYTPTITGMFQEKVTSLLHGDKAFRSIEVVESNSSDVAVDVASVSNKIDLVAADVSLVKTKVDALNHSILASGYFA